MGKDKIVWRDIPQGGAGVGGGGAQPLPPHQPHPIAFSCSDLMLAYELGKTSYEGATPTTLASLHELCRSQPSRFLKVLRGLHIPEHRVHQWPIPQWAYDAYDAQGY